jgi:hypothetical protein
MKKHPTTRHLVLACLLVSGCMQAVTAAPPGPAPVKPKTVAAKPKLAPRPIPGMSGNPAPTLATAAPARKMTAPVANPATSAGNGPELAHILMIYRRGSVSLPATTPQPSVPKASVEIVQPVSMTSVPRPGEVRIITKEEAQKFLAKPEN